MAIVPFDRNRSVSRVLEISLVSDGSRNGSNPDLSIVVLNRLTLRYGLVLRRSQNTTLLLTALFGHAAGNVLHTGASFILTSYGDCLRGEYVGNGRQIVHWRGNLLRIRWNIGHGKSSLTFAARAGSMRTVLHKRNLFAGERFDLDTLNHDNIDDRVSPQHRHREDSATAFQLRTKDVS